MIDQKTLLVGYDLSDDFTQISCYNTKYFEPESIGTSTDQEQFLIPTVLGVKAGSKEWLFGETAIAAAESDNAILIDHLVEKAVKEQVVTVFDSSFPMTVLLEKFFRKTLSYLKVKYADQGIAKIVVTVPEYSEPLKECILTALAALGIGRDRACVKSHASSAMYYALNQSKELWMNDVGIFHYDGEHLYFYHIAINRKTKPSAVTIQKEDFTDSLGKLTEDENVTVELAYIFLKLAKRILSKYVISTVYITGKGFEGKWIDATLQELCMGRRVFKGQNLYTKGACYMARELAGEKKLSDYILLTDEMLKTSVWISAYLDAKNQDLMLAKIGTPWYEINESVEIIFEKEPELTIYTKGLFENEVNTYHLALDYIPDREERTTRVELSVKCKEPDFLEVIIRDLGFGELFPATHCQSSLLIPLNEKLS